MSLESDLRNLGYRERSIHMSISTPEYVSSKELKEYEFSNLIRLGVLKSIPRSYGYVSSHDIRNEPNSEYISLKDLEVEKLRKAGEECELDCEKYGLPENNYQNAGACDKCPNTPPF